MARSKLLLEAHLKALRLPTFLREYDKLARQCAAESLDSRSFLQQLCELELLDREQRATERRIKAAKFPVTKSLDTFDFPSLPALNKKLVLELARCEFIDRRENVQGSTLVTSNLPFNEWTEVFGSKRLTGALLDRLTHHVHILEMNGESFRLIQSKKKRAHSLG